MTRTQNKKTLWTTCVLLIFIIATSLFLSACGSAADAQGKKGASNNKSNSLKIVTTIFPEYDWVREILGKEASDTAELTLLLDNGVDLHSYQPTAEDILKISTCDLFVYVGGESDEWVEDALKEAVNPDMVVLNLLETLGDNVKEEELAEGMQGEEEDAEAAPEEAEEEPEYDEHVWLSLKNTKILCSAIADALISIDSEHKNTYQDNLDAYEAKLDALDTAYQQAVLQARIKTLLFGDRFPFRYLTDDYGLDYYAAFAGCSAETEASFETITFLAGKVDELGLNTVLTIEGGDQKIAETIIQNTRTKNQTIRTLDSMQTTAAKDVETGTTYLSVMEQNLGILKEALQ